MLACHDRITLDRVTAFVAPLIVVFRKVPLLARSRNSNCRIAAPLHCSYAVVMSEQGFHGFLTVQGRGTVALPPALRARYRLDTPGAQVELTERDDGVLELRPVVPVPASEAWFWEERWQAGERHVDELVAAGQVRVFAGPDEFLEDLEAGAPTK